ncbi:hypothetical protein BDV32DRAFT_124331 [Aspergillus pseudonomiae]|nr:hypothetical protein BDV32DRAFT_124331 [Aspergillus pseudonomiae]
MAAFRVKGQIRVSYRPSLRAFLIVNYEHPGDFAYWTEILSELYLLIYCACLVTFRFISCFGLVRIWFRV